MKRGKYMLNLTMKSNENEPGKLTFSTDILDHNMMFSGPEGTGQEELLSFFIKQFIKREGAKVFYLYTSFLEVDWLFKLLPEEIKTDPNFQAIKIELPEWSKTKIIGKTIVDTFMTVKYKRLLSQHKRLLEDHPEEPTLVIYDGFYNFTENEFFKKLISEQLTYKSRSGKHTTILCSTSMIDFNQNPLFDIIQEWCDIRLFASSHLVVNPPYAKNYEQWNFTETDIRSLVRLKPRKEFLCKVANTTSSFVFNLN